MIYFLFFCSGLSGLIYQVVWVREFGNVFGNTVYSASLVVAMFMLGLGFGSYGAGVWADRRYTRQTESLLRAYGQIELIVAALGLSISLVLPGLNALSAISSSYVIDQTGWFVLSSISYVSRGAIVFVLLTPVTLLMGGTLTLLIRHLVRRDVETAGWKIAVLYGVNTAGAAAGAFLTDFVLVPAAGQRATQMVAVALNVIAGVGALALARGASLGTASSAPAVASRDSRSRKASSARKPSAAAMIPARTDIAAGGRSGGDAVMWTSLALGLSGFAALGMEILWFRHFTLLLGGFRAVFSLLLTIILIGMGVGSLVGGVLVRRTTRPAHWLMIVQSAFVAFTLLGLFRADVRNILATRGSVPATSGVGSGLSRTFSEVWFDARPILLEVGCAALLMGLAFPVANAIVQRAERSVGRRAGVLYLANTVGAVGGSIATGFLLLPWLGMQGSATVLMIAAALASVPLYLATVGSRTRRAQRTSRSLRHGRSRRCGVAAHQRRGARPLAAAAVGVPARSRHGSAKAGRTAVDDERGGFRDHRGGGSAGPRARSHHQRASDVFDGAARPAVHARARPYSSPVDGAALARSGDRVRRRQLDPRGHPASVR